MRGAQVPTHSQSRHLREALRGHDGDTGNVISPSPAPEVASLASCLPRTLTGGNSQVGRSPKSRPARQNHAPWDCGQVSLCVNLCVCGGGVATALLSPPSFQIRPIQSGVALRNQATQQPGPALTRGGPQPCSQLTPSLPPKREFTHVCRHKASSLGPQVSCTFALHTAPPAPTARNHPLNKGVGAWVSQTLVGTWGLEMLMPPRTP